MPGAIRPNCAPSELHLSGVRARLECSLQPDGREGTAAGMGQEVISVMSSPRSKAPRNNTSDPTGDARRGDFRPLKIPGAAGPETSDARWNAITQLARIVLPVWSCRHAQASPPTSANRLLRATP
jgi:hypothetical protein